MKRKRGEYGRGKRWLEEHMDWSRDECLIWLFPRDKDGYGRLWDAATKRNTRAHRLMCEAVHGLPEAVGAVAMHLCSNGHLGCVNPRHLAWGTPAQNNVQKSVDGRSTFGERSAKAKLTDDAVIEIRREVGAVPVSTLAERYRVARATIYQTAHRKTWKHIPAEADAAHRRIYGEFSPNTETR